MMTTTMNGKGMFIRAESTERIYDALVLDAGVQLSLCTQ